MKLTCSYEGKTLVCTFSGTKKNLASVIFLQDTMHKIEEECIRIQRAHFNKPPKNSY